MAGFDLFHIRQWREGYQLEVGIARPNNAPRYKHTGADRKRRMTAAKKNLELCEKLFSFDELVAEINKLKMESE